MQHDEKPSVTSSQIASSTYNAWFATEPITGQGMLVGPMDCPVYLHSTVPLNHMHLGSELRFCVGAHDLGIAVRRQRNIARAQRPCHLCDSDASNDEFHMVFMVLE